MPESVRQSPTPPSAPPSHWLFGVAGQFRDNAGFLAFLLDGVQKYGDVVKMEYGLIGDLLRRRRRSASYFLNDPTDIKHVLVTNQKNYPKDLNAVSNTPAVKKVFGRGLLLSNDPFHLKQRRIMQPFFNHQPIASYADMMIEKTKKVLESWKEGLTLDLSHEISQLTMAIATKAFFNIELSDQSDEFSRAVRLGQRTLAESFFSWVSYLPFSLYFPTKLNRDLRQVVLLLDGTISAAIARRRAGKESGSDLLSALLNAQDEEGTAMNDRQLRDEIVTLFLAGHETTANALSFALYLLSQHPDVEAKLLEELRSVLGDSAPSFDRLPRLTYTEMVFAEALRLYPPAWILQPRVAREGETLPSGTTICAGDVLVLIPYITHRNPKFFPDPERFDPGRFTPEACAGRPEYAYFPFSGGSRSCIGERFAKMEGVLLLAMIARQFKMTLSQNQTVVPNPLFTLCPKNGVWMRMEPLPVGPVTKNEKDAYGTVRITQTR